MKILNKYTYLFVGLIASASLILLIVLPRFETQEFNPERVENISSGVTTTSIPVEENQGNDP